MGKHSAQGGQDHGYGPDGGSGPITGRPAGPATEPPYGGGPVYGAGPSYGGGGGPGSGGSPADGSRESGPGDGGASTYGRPAREHGGAPGPVLGGPDWSHAPSGGSTPGDSTPGNSAPGGPGSPGAVPGGGRPGAGLYRRSVPPGGPGTGRRRRADSPEDTGGFAVIGPREAGGPPHGHPEHREHGAWGRAGGWSGDAGPSGGRHDVTRDPVEEWAEDWAPYDTGRAGRTPGGPVPVVRTSPLQPAGRVIPRPRQEFVDAFDAPAPVQPGPPARPAPDGPGPDAPGAFDGPDGLGPAVAPEHGSMPRGGKGRTLSGAAAAAVVAVLAVVIGGQVAGHGGGAEPSGTAEPGGAPHTGDGPASRSGPRPSATPTTTAVPSFTDLMGRQYPLDPKLKLSGAFETVPGHQAAPGHGTVLRVRVDTEKGLPLDARMFSDAVFRTLNDPRSWGHGGTMTFERVSSGPADIVITLASPGTTAAWCAKSGLDTAEENVSCDAASTPRTMINAYRWAQGAVTFGPSRMLEYRQMLINHEVGHRLGHNHTGCPKAGALAPVMMQQTKFLSLDGGPTCRPNAWPFPAATPAS